MVATSTPASNAPDVTAGSRSLLARACQLKDRPNASGLSRRTIANRSGACSRYYAHKGCSPPNQQVTFLTDGGDDVRELPLYLNPQAEHLLDWFHITMRLTVLSQMAKGVRSRDNPNLSTDLAEELERLKWYLWHGNVFLARQTIRYLQLDADCGDDSPEQQKLS